VTEILEAMTAPTTDGQPSLPRRQAPKGLLPSTWLERAVRIQYTDAYGAGVETSGVLADLYPFGMVVSGCASEGATKMCLSWEAVRVVELIND
jgi:hypothetical protein